MFQVFSSHLWLAATTLVIADTERLYHLQSSESSTYRIEVVFDQ